MNTSVKKRILIADDEQGIRDLVSFLLDPDEFEVEPVDNGEDAVDRITKNAYDVVILDVHMPKLTGPQVLKKIRKIKPDQVVIIFSSSSDPNFIQETEAEKDGIATCLYKPFDVNDLIEAIRKSTGGATKG